MPPEHSTIQFTLGVLRRLELLGCRLNLLIVTIDEEDPSVKDYLVLETQTNNGPTSPLNYSIIITPDKWFKRLVAWNSFQGENKIWPEQPLKLASDCDGLSVQLLVRGTSCPVEDSRRMRPTGAVVARAFEAWLSTRNIRVRATRYSGPF